MRRKAVDLATFLFSFRGRVNRLKFWTGTMGVFAAACLVMKQGIVWTRLAYPWNLLALLAWLLACDVSLLALAARRLHDIGISARWLLPILGAWFLVIFVLLLWQPYTAETMIATLTLFAGYIWFACRRGTASAALISG